MATLIPDEMPVDWTSDASARYDIDPFDPEVVEKMEAAYRTGLEELQVAGMLAALKERCMLAVAPTADEDTA